MWAEDPDTCWVDGEVVKINGEEAEIQATNGKKVITHAFGFCQLSGKLILGFEFFCNPTTYRHAAMHVFRLLRICRNYIPKIWKQLPVELMT